MTEHITRFAVYSKDGCPYCTKIENVLELAKLKYVVFKLGKDFTKEQFYSQFGDRSTFPQVICNETQIGGCIDTVKFLKEMKLV